MKHDQNRTTDNLAQGQAGRGGVGAESVDQAARELDREGDLRIADWERAFEEFCLLEVAIRLAQGDGAGAREVVGGIGQVLVLLEQGSRQVEPLGFLDIAGTGHLTYTYACLCHKSRDSSRLLSLSLSIWNGPVELEVIFCVQAVLSPLLANIYLDALDKELERRGHSFCRYADDCNIYVGSQMAAERTLASIRTWIEKHLRLKVNPAKSGTGRVWERKFLGFRLDRERRIGVAPESIERFKAKVREMWRGNQSRTSNQLRDAWAQYVRGWWGYFRRAEVRRPIFRLEGWLRRHIRKCFWLRWHSAAGREHALRRLGVHRRVLKTVRTGRGAWFMANTSTMNAGLKVQTLRRYGFLMPSDLAGW